MQPNSPKPAPRRPVRPAQQPGGTHQATPGIARNHLPPGMGGGEKGFTAQPYQAQPGSHVQYTNAAQQRGTLPGQSTYQTQYYGPTQQPLKVGGGSRIHGVLIIGLGFILILVGGGFSWLLALAGDVDTIYYIPWLLVIGFLALVSGIGMLFKK